MYKLNLRKHMCDVKAVCLTLMAFAVMLPSEMRAQTLRLGNCEETVVTYLTVSDTETSGSSLFYPQSVMSAYKGCRITEIAVALDGTVGEGTARVFIASSLDGQPEYEQAFSSSKRGWCSVTLDNPYVIDGNAVYIGYEIDGLKYLPYGEVFAGNEEWVWRNSEGWVRYDGVYSAAMYATVAGESLPVNNIRLGAVKMPGYATKGNPVKYEGELKNLGAADVNSLTFSYIVNGEEHATETVSGLSVKPREAGFFTLDGPVFEQEGDYDVQMRVLAVNGGEDAIPEDNASAVRKTVCRNSFTPRKTLLELFSTERCTACPGAHTAIAKELEGVTDVVEICHHAGFYTDKFTLPESQEYEWFYAQNRVFAPAMMFDRTNFGDYYPEMFSYCVPMMSASGASAKLFREEAVAVPAFTTVAITADFDEASRQLKVNVEGEPLLPAEGNGTVGLYVWLTEDNIYTDTQAGTNGDFLHRHVARKSLTPVWGMPVDVASGYDADFTATIPEEWDVRNMRVVAFVAFYDPDDKNGCKVLNAEHLSIVDPGSTGIVNVGDESAGNEPDVFTVSGRRVLTKASSADLERLGKGVYIVNGRKFIK